MGLQLSPPHWQCRLQCQPAAHQAHTTGALILKPVMTCPYIVRSHACRARGHWPQPEAGHVPQGRPVQRLHLPPGPVLQPVWLVRRDGRALRWRRRLRCLRPLRPSWSPGTTGLPAPCAGAASATGAQAGRWLQQQWQWPVFNCRSLCCVVPHLDGSAMQWPLLCLGVWYWTMS